MAYRLSVAALAAMRGMNAIPGEDCIVAMPSGAHYGVHHGRLIRRCRSGRLVIEIRTHDGRTIRLIVDTSNVRFTNNGGSQGWFPQRLHSMTS